MKTKVKYQVQKGNTYHQCAWLVVIPHTTVPDDVIAEFWDRKDAQLFIRAKKWVKKNIK